MIRDSLKKFFLFKNRMFHCTVILSLLLHLAGLFVYENELRKTEFPVDAGRDDYIQLSIDGDDSVKNKRVIKKEPDPIPSVVIIKNLVSIENIRAGKKSALKQNITEDKKVYEHEILRKIHQSKYYPLYAKRRGIQGIVSVSFTVAKNGRLLDEVKIQKPAIYTILNSAALQTVRKAAPFPPFPTGLDLQSLNFTVDIVFELKQG